MNGGFVNENGENVFKTDVGYAMYGIEYFIQRLEMMSNLRTSISDDDLECLE